LGAHDADRDASTLEETTAPMALLERIGYGGLAAEPVSRAMLLEAAFRRVRLGGLPRLR
jgi:hypothetical protein